MSGVVEEIRAFVVENFLFGQSEALPDAAESLLEAGIIDSTGVLELVMFLEKDFGITVEDAELIPENLDSLNQIVGYVQRKQADGAA